MGRYLFFFKSWYSFLSLFGVHKYLPLHDFHLQSCLQNTEARPSRHIQNALIASEDGSTKRKHSWCCIMHTYISLFSGLPQRGSSPSTIRRIHFVPWQLHGSLHSKLSRSSAQHLSHPKSTHWSASPSFS
jgi:hypothetical protein